MKSSIQTSKLMFNFILPKIVNSTKSTDNGDDSGDEGGQGSIGSDWWL